jgi:phthalate 4,5-cis-dihydrodiol dehydrogenase
MVLKSAAPDAKLLRVGLIGPGRHAALNLLPAIRLMPAISVTAVAARTHEHARATAARWGVPSYTNDWRDLIDQNLVDAVIVSVSPNIHEEVVRACLLARMPVFVEKPPAASLLSLRSLADLERSNRAAPVFVGFNFEFSDSYNRFIKGITGQSEIKAMRVRFVSSGPESPGEYGSTLKAILYEAALHAVSLVVTQLGALRDVMATACEFDGKQFMATIVVQHQSGGYSTIEFGNYAPRLEVRIEAITRSGRVGVLTQFSDERIWIGGTADEYVGYERSPRRGGYDRAGYGPELAAFFGAIRNRTPSPSSLTKCVPVYEILGEIERQLDM